MLAMLAIAASKVHGLTGAAAADHMNTISECLDASPGAKTST